MMRNTVVTAIALTLAGRRLTVVDDSYNSNPDSARAAIDVLASSGLVPPLRLLPRERAG